MEAAERIERIKKILLPKIKPSKDEIEATTAHANMITERLKEVVPKDVEILTVGSIAHGTYLSGDADIDIFLLFGKDKGREEIVKKGIEYAKKIVGKRNERYEIRYAEHPYLRLYLDDYNMRADIVPAFKILNMSDKGTAVDRTPLHTEFINSHLNERQRDDVRMLKYLLKAHNMYGAEIKTRGFSGYLCELLIYHYGSFTKLIENFSNIRLPLYIEPATGNAVQDAAVFKKFNSSFVVVDPVDPNRNVAAVVSMGNIAKLAALSRELLMKPSVKLFDRVRVSENTAHSILNKFLADTGLKPYLLVVDLPDKSQDTTWPQLNKVANRIKGIMEKFGFVVYLNVSWIYGGEGFMLYLMPLQRLKTRILKGPELTNMGASDAFLRSHKDAYGVLFVDDYVYVIAQNKYESVEEIIGDVIKKGIAGGSADIKIKGRARFYSTVPRVYSYEAYEELLAKITI